MRKGVNAFIERKTGLLEPRLPPEFLLLRHAPEPWRPADSVVGLKMMALNLGTNLNFEMVRLTLAAQGLSAAEIEDLMPPDRRGSRRRRCRRSPSSIRCAGSAMAKKQAAAPAR